MVSSWQILKLLSVTLQLSLSLSEGARYNDLISCEGFTNTVNSTNAQLEQEALRLGGCIPFTTETLPLISSTRDNPCNRFYTADVDTVYLPSGRALNNLTLLNSFLANLLFDLLRRECRDAATRAVCYYYYPPCGNITRFTPPNALCQDVCTFLTTDLCEQEWLDFTIQVNAIREFVEEYQVQIINCSQPGAALGGLPHCCSNAGVDIASGPEGTESSNPGTTLTTASVSAGLAALLIVGVAAVMTTLCMLIRKSRSKVILQFGAEIDNSPASENVTTPDVFGCTRYVPYSSTGDVAVSRARVSSGFIRNMDHYKLLIPGRHLQLLDIVGQGEFGVVHRGTLTGWQGRTTAELVAVKTLKNSHSTRDVEELTKESEKMRQFKHPNVLNLIGVCIEAGDTPLLVMPYMANGSLLVYLRKKRPHLTMAGEAGAEMIADAQRKLLSICLQIGRGMSYLAQQKFVHRDLAARNCMIDQHLLIKVADFGLSEDIYTRNYFRQGQSNEEGSAVKLPIRWMALESLLDHVFTEKTDVWSYGVTCWEVFSLGHTPYPAVDPFSLIKFLQNGNRLDKPANAACTPQVYDVIAGCWAESPNERPSFEDLSQAINSLLEGVAGYMDFSAFSNESAHAGASGYDHLAGVGSGCNHLEPLENQNADN